MNDHLITFGSVCSGIEAASVAWEPLGWKAAWLSEIDQFPSAVLAHRFPSVPNVGDMTTVAARIRSGELPAPDVLCGGTPCQAFSVAGLRGGLTDARGQLTLSFVEIANAIDEQRASLGQPSCTVIWENVVGVLSSTDNAFGCFLAALVGASEPLEPTGGKWSSAGLVVGEQRTVAWRVLDAQHFGVAQRRRRVWLVASAGSLDPSEVLFERAGVQGHLRACGLEGDEASEPAGECPSAEAGAYSIRTANTGANGCGIQRELTPTLDCAVPPAVAYEYHQQDARVREIADNVSPTITRHWGTGGNNVPLVVSEQWHLFNAEGSIGATLTASNLGKSLNNQTPLVVKDAPLYVVRRLTPVECERLQGFPDGWTAIPWRGKPASECPDSLRYKALGNSWAVPVARWVGTRVAEQL